MTSPPKAPDLRAVLVATLALGAGVAGYYRFVRPMVMGWGSRPEERTRPLPGDEIVPRPGTEATHAITIAAPPEAVWPWLVQLGTDKAGWYSYDWLDHGGEPSAESLIPEFQQLVAGERIRMSPDGKVSIPVVAVEANRALVLGGGEEGAEFAASWVFVIEPTGGGTRLLVRFRATFPPTLAGRLMLAAIEPAHFIMQRKQLLNLKARAERLAVRPKVAGGR